MGFAVLTRNPLKWHPKREPKLEFQGVLYSIPQRLITMEAIRCCDFIKDGKFQSIVIPTWSGDWQRAALRQIGATDEDITAAIVYARLMGETV